MRFIFAACVAGALSGCVDAGLATDPNSTIDLMRGVGSASVSPSGRRSFRYVLHPSAGSDRAQHDWLISRWAASADGCPRGYKVAKVETVQGMTVYSGPCS